MPGPFRRWRKLLIIFLTAGIVLAGSGTFMLHASRAETLADSPQEGAPVFMPIVQMGALVSDVSVMPVASPGISPSPTHTQEPDISETPTPIATETAFATMTPTVAMTETPAPTETPTFAPTETPTEPPTPTETSTDTPAPTMTFTSTPTPTHTPVPDPAVPAGDDWLSYTNYYRSLAGLPAVTERAVWSLGAERHARYMVKNDFIGHTEDPGNSWYSAQGAAAAQSGNVTASYDVNRGFHYALDSWMQAPFHAIGILDPRLQQVGFGVYYEADGGYQMGATLDVLRGRGAVLASVQFPVKWPANGVSVPLNLYWGENPDPLTSCPGYSAPAGLPIILQLGAGNVTPDITDHSFTNGSVALEHCIFDETSYTNDDMAQQQRARSTLNSHDAIVLIPRAPLERGSEYHVSITSNGQTHAWSFHVTAE
jgi:uncharacterized protein YkwD